MASHLDRWEKDPFFRAAEEVQESADRMESMYRTLIHASKEPSVWNSDAVRRDLRTAIGTTKWQLEEFERAVLSSYNKTSTDNTKDRHRDFINAIETQISRVETSWNDSFSSTGKPPRPWVKLNEGERKELALFLAGSVTPIAHEEQPAKTRRKQKAAAAKEKKFSMHRRAASASADIGSWKITVDDDVGKDEKAPRKIPSFSGLLNTLEYTASKLKWPKNGYRKLKQEVDVAPIIQIHDMSCPEHYDDDDHDRWLHRWCDAIQRQLQRLQYYMLYSCRTQTIFWVVVIICLLALFVLHSI
ncbi:unnamed protein product [Lactuca saligna]|uniref:Syntaxin 6/10/61 N-terminal domain-containing protein n=1 Tax=Lactuca saligna TaxID=75948 RepID=A0AA35V5B7_LACSI|nr:unnamed protein product [Lactuca saligna]